MREFLRILQSGETLGENQMLEAMTKIMDGHATEVEIAAFLTGLAERGETAEEITGAAKVLRSKARTIKAPPGTVDCCGTGGDGTGTYNISTAVALVAAACDVPVAKHGNRAASSKSGAADVLENLGVNLTMPADALELALEDIRFVFLMAPNHHQAMRHVAPIRKKLGVKTIFNLLGPLSNPADTKFQLVGVYDRKWVRPMAEALKNLGSERAWVVHGSDGLDEITTTGPTFAAMLEDGKITEREINVDEFGLIPSKPEALKGGDAAVNAKALRQLLNGEKSAYRDIVVANAAAVLCIHGSAQTLHEGAEKAAAAIDAGHAQKTLHDYIKFSLQFGEA
ncbi:MAG: anthranilate phosphoribosyltransferase [Alphaproteobacteria bacterium PRO2]|nr:anthranilate phosphoribosyltransferase [Alphaproteobacteria bacterium PRO2]